MRRMLDALFNFDLGRSRVFRQVRQDAKTRPPRRVLIVGVEVPSRPGDIRDVMRRLTAGTRHDVVISITTMQDRGKFANIDEAIRIAPEPLAAFDWLIATDDDIGFASSFLDDLIALAEAGDLSMAQPAHAFESHTSYAITRRRRGSLVRQSSFVEIGPLTIIRSDAFATYIPFPPSRWCYGIDVLWSELARKHGYRMGIIDGAPVRHLRPVAGSYGMAQAVEEGRAMLRRFNIERRRAELWDAQIVIAA